MPEKTARKTSADPAQEKLRQDKANWNKEVSSFINDLIHLKKTMNGWPSKFFKERSRITQPIPADPSTIIGSLTGDFQELAQRGEAIVQEQLTYTKSRRQKQPQQAPANTTTTPAAPAAPEAPAPTNPSAGQDLSKQLAAFEKKYGEEFIAEGSNKLTRTWTRLLNAPGSIGWGSSAKRRRHRMNMLKRAATVYKLLGKFQVKIVTPFSNKESIKESYDFMRAIKNEWGALELDLRKYVGLLSGEFPLSKEETEEEMKRLKEQKKSPEEPAKENKQEQVPVDSAISDSDAVNGAQLIRSDYVAISGSKIQTDVDSVLGGAINQFMKEPALTKADVGRQVIQQYQSLLGALRSKYSVGGNSLKEISDAINAGQPPTPPPDANVPKTASEQMEKVAQDFLKKYLGKARHNILPNTTSDLRVELYDRAKDLRKEVNTFMDIAESRKTLATDFENQYRVVADSIHRIFADMMKLYRLYFRIPKEMQEID